MSSRATRKDKRLGSSATPTTSPYPGSKARNFVHHFSGLFVPMSGASSVLLGFGIWTMRGVLVAIARLRSSVSALFQSVLCSNVRFCDRNWPDIDPSTFGVYLTLLAGYLEETSSWTEYPGVHAW